MAALPAGGYVGTSGKKYVQKDGKWVQVGSVSASYKKDGRCTRFTSIDSEGQKWEDKYTWKGNYITYGTCNYRDSGEYKWKYDKNHKLVYRTLGGMKYTYKWKGRTASYKDKYSKETLTFNKKGQITKAVYDSSYNTYKFSYYKNGNRKKVSSSYSTLKYNSRGDLTSVAYTFRGFKANFKYKKDSKGRIKQTEITYTDEDGKHNAKIVWNKWKKVSHVRNCDATGWTDPEGIIDDLLISGALFR